MIKIYQVLELIEKIAPKSIALTWDKIGLQIGSMDANIKNILIAMEITHEVIEEAIHLKSDLIISHHPLIFNPITNINPKDHKTKMIIDLVNKNISVYVAHTNMDASPCGINFTLANKICLKNIKALSHIKMNNLKKLIIYIPNGYEKKVRDNLLALDLFKSEKYSKMSFMCSGEGTFLPSGEAKPFIGKSENFEKTGEFRLEVLIDDKNIARVLNKIRLVHPYEEMAYDIFPVEIFYPNAGIGFFGELETETTLKEFAQILKEKLNIPFLRMTGDGNKKVKKIGIISGSGARYINNVRDINLDVLITGDIKHHDAHDALDNDLALIDAGHFQTEKIFVDIVYNLLKKKKDLKSKINVVKSKISTDPFWLIN